MEHQSWVVQNYVEAENRTNQSKKRMAQRRMVQRKSMGIRICQTEPQQTYGNTLRLLGHVSCRSDTGLGHRDLVRHNQESFILILLIIKEKRKKELDMVTSPLRMNKTPNTRSIIWHLAPINIENQVPITRRVGSHPLLIPRI